jgi:hypothetical protein
MSGVGVIQSEEVSNEAYFGYRYVGKRLKPNRDSIFCPVSLAKYITTAAVDVLWVRTSGLEHTSL